MVIRRVGPFSCAKVAGVLYTIIGLVFGAFVSLFSLVGAFGSGSGSGFGGAIFGVAAVVVLPVFYGCLGFVMTLITAALYNVVAGTVGGVEVEIQ